MRIGICEDDVIMCDTISEMICNKRSDSFTYKISQYYSGDQLWFEYQESKHPYDLIILDIELPGRLNGIEVARKIREQDDDVFIILLTAFTKYALVGYEVQPLRYLLKPVQKDMLFQLIDYAESRIKASWNEFLNLTVQGGFLRIPFDNILFIESDRHHIYIHTNKENYKQYKKLSDIYMLLDDRFVYTHKSYIVNLDHIKIIGSRYTQVIMCNDTIIPISKNKKSEFINSLMRYDTQAYVQA